MTRISSQVQDRNHISAQARHPSDPNRTPPIPVDILPVAIGPNGYPVGLVAAPSSDPSPFEPSSYRSDRDRAIEGEWPGVLGELDALFAWQMGEQGRIGR